MYDPASDLPKTLPYYEVSRVGKGQGSQWKDTPAQTYS